MTNLMKNVLIVDLSQIALQVYDKGAITKDQLSKIIGINFNNGEFNNKIWENNGSFEAIDKSYLLMQLFDKQLITKDILINTVFGDLEE